MTFSFAFYFTHIKINLYSEEIVVNSTCNLWEHCGIGMQAHTKKLIDLSYFFMTKLWNTLNCNKHMYVEVIKINNLNFQELTCWWYKR